MSQKKARKQSEEPIYRLRDAGKAVGSCDGYFDPSENQLGGPLHPDKTYQDHLPKEERPRYQAWLKRNGS